MTNTVEPSERAAAIPDDIVSGPITLINSFVVPVDRERDFLALWAQTSAFFRGQPGFVSLRMHRALSQDVSYRYVNVALWNSTNQFAAAHDKDEFHALVANPAWREFPSNPALYEVIVEHDAEEAAA